jgi:hypothetical protein
MEPFFFIAHQARNRSITSGKFSHELQSDLMVNPHHSPDRRLAMALLNPKSRHGTTATTR